MEKPKRWQLFLIAAVIFLTVYNILPTVFFYTKPLQSPIDQKRAEKIEADIAVRVSALEKESVSWLESFCSLLKLKPLSIALDASNSQFVQIKFKELAEAQKFRTYLPRAGSLIGFVPAQLDLYDRDPMSKTVVVQRRISVHLEPKTVQTYFQFGSKWDAPKQNAQRQPTDFYRAIIDDRLIFLGTSAGGTTESASLIQTAVTHLQDPAAQDLLLLLSQNILNFTKIFDENSSIAKRYFASFSQIEVANQRQFIEQWITALDKVKDQVRLERIALAQEPNLDTIKQQRLEWLSNRENLLINSAALVKKHATDFSAGKTPLSFTTMKALLKEAPISDRQQTITLSGHHPFIESITVDWDSERLILNLYADLQQMKDRLTSNDQFDQIIYNEIAALSRQAGEKINPYLDRFEIQLSALADSKTFIALRLYNIAKAEADTMRMSIATNWMPQHPDLQRNVFPIWDYETYQSLPADQKKLGLVVFAPSMQSKMPPKGFKMNSIYVVAKGVDKILDRYENQESDAAKQFMRDFNELRSMLQKNGFTGYSGAAYPLASEFKSDFIFEHEDYYQDLLKATRENFTVHGTKRYALLELSNVEQRILTENKIDNSLHEDLLKWRDDYRAAQVDLRGTSKYDVPAPTSNAFWDNLKLSCIKYFRGDERKVIRWGLDLSGGKTVQIELRDNNNHVVTNEADIRQGINELYNRVNKMGVSEVTIRQEGNTIALDFPGSQSLSASDLVKASSMYFHIVNEKFMTNPTLAEAAHRFLQDVWNEAVVTNRKDVEEINAIAWRHLYGESNSTDAAAPRTVFGSVAAKTLYENGLRLAHPQEMSSSSIVDDTFSKITLYRGDDFTDWHRQTHPLLLVFRNFTLEGANLENVRGSYDPSKGNYLAFGVQGSHTTKDGIKITPRDDLQAWTERYSKEKIAATPLESYSNGNGWRMAVILNGTVITAPALESTLRDSASITGSFTQREINKLEADLKAGSLSFTPRILSEKNVSPELGGQERLHGIVATICALVLAMATMIGYYRFGGLIASVAVLFNLLIMWAALQNLGATLTLAGIAGVILTVAMAVDANVLVFERIREEFASTGRIAAAVHAGYRKAFSAIIDSNITTLIAALILMHFDAGPIRGFAVTLIIGILSSLFTALFATRFFFTWWVQNPSHRELKMSNFIKGAHFNFLKFTKPTVVISAIVILIGSYLLITQRQTILGMDFTGGYVLSVELPAVAKNDYRTVVENALIKQGLTAQEFQIRELHPSNNVRIFLSRSLEQQGRPFAGMPVSNDAAEVAYPFESNPKILWIVKALQNSQIQLAPAVLQDLDQNWTAISGQMSDTMRTHAIIGICIALLCILVYITLRFEFKYAISATLCLVHDLVFCVGVVGILHLLGVPIQIDLHIIAALMTIVGYSLNDTIIVFDRIREDARHMRKNNLSEVINHALNVTLSRTLMTSGITLLVLIPLIVLGGSTIFGFALVMAIGVIFGTLSSLFIAAPLMQYFHNREMQKQQRVTLHEQ
ncbi:MAG TPA: protein translocase subunit SecD [Rhabdochlamydiaceae bacterium]|jgi:SecD/SecF fusion protein|nr:protein translocase subunit SecD [Rhabdochlamydiaceae bacterium]